MFVHSLTGFILGGACSFDALLSLERPPWTAGAAPDLISSTSYDLLPSLRFPETLTLSKTRHTFSRHDIPLACVKARICMFFRLSQDLHDINDIDVVPHRHLNAFLLTDLRPFPLAFCLFQHKAAPLDHSHGMHIPRCLSVAAHL